MPSWIKIAIGIIGFFGVILGYTTQLTHLSGHLDLAGLIKNGLLLGSIVGGILGFTLYQKGKDQDARFSIYAGMLVLGLAIGPLVLATVNRIFSDEVQPVEFELLSVQPVMGSRGGVMQGKAFIADAHLLNMRREETTYTIKIGADLNDYLLDDESIILNIRKGGLGYDYVDHAPSSNAL